MITADPEVIDADVVQRDITHQLDCLGLKTDAVGNGTFVRLKKGEIIFRVTDKLSVLIVSYKVREQHRKSIGNSIVGLVWFIQFLKRMKQYNIRQVKGCVDIFPYRYEGGISAQRLARLYQIYGAVVVNDEGSIWASVDIEYFHHPEIKIEHVR